MIDLVHQYHDGTKHHFHRFARSLGYLDWASQPHPFRSFDGGPVVPLPHRSAAGPPVTYVQLYQPGPAAAPLPLSIATIGDMLRYALGLSAWKQFRESRWALRVNPSSGNLHPTEAYIVAGPAPGLSERAGVYHYAPDRHALERRCAFDEPRGATTPDGAAPWCFIVLTS